MFDLFDRRLDAHGYAGDIATRHALIDDDVRLNTQGLDVWLSASSNASLILSKTNLPMNAFRAYRIHRIDGRITPRFEQLTLDDLTAGDVVVRVSYSDINYKDALAATGTSPILRKYPLAGGIDLAGEVVGSADPRYSSGQKVLVTGCGLSETRDGGYSEYARLEGDSIIPLPDGITELDAMKLGTAGFTAALAIHRMEQNGLTPQKGTVVVTGATGGVGSLAINMLAGRGYEVAAVSGKPEADTYLRELGATQILRRQSLDLGMKPMEAILWAGAVDNVGGEVLTWLTRTVDFWGSIASIGLAGGNELHTTVHAVHPTRRQPAGHQFVGHAA